MSLSFATEKNLKQESALQEERNSSQCTDAETPTHEEAEGHSTMTAPQVEDSLLHYWSFDYLGLKSVFKMCQLISHVVKYLLSNMSALIQRRCFHLNEY